MLWSIRRFFVLKLLLSKSEISIAKQKRMHLKLQESTHLIVANFDCACT